jgi:predicted nucleic acid-binding protein
MILLDTNVVSEPFRPQPSEVVLGWYKAQTEEDLFLCTPVLAELRYGLERLPSGARRRTLENAVNLVEGRFLARTLSLDKGAAHEFGRILAHRNRIGRPLEIMDGLIAAIALSHRATLATRDLSDFEGIGLELINPFVPHV